MSVPVLTDDSLLLKETNELRIAMRSLVGATDFYDRRTQSGRLLPAVLLTALMLASTLDRILQTNGVRKLEKTTPCKVAIGCWGSTRQLDASGNSVALFC